MLGCVLLVVASTAQIADLPPGAVLRLGDARWRTAGEIRYLHFSTDGTTLCAWTTGRDGRLRPVVWNAATGCPMASLPERSPPALADGTTQAVRLKDDRVLTAGPGNAGRVWDATTARQLARLTGHTGSVTAVALSAEGKRLATGSADGLVRIWDAETFRPLSEPRGHTAAVRTIRVSADSKRAVTTGDDGTARVWDLTTGKELREFPGDSPVEITPDGLGVILPAGGVTVRDILTGLEVIPAGPPSRPTMTPTELLSRWGLCLAVSHDDGRTIAIARQDGALVLSEAATAELRRELPGHGTKCRVMAFTPDGSRLLTVGDDHTVLVWDVRPQSMTLPDAVRRETKAAKLWATMCVGKADAAYLAMARLSAEPDAAVKTARMRIRPAKATDPDSPAQRLADVRAVVLLESLGTPEAREFLKELAAGEASAFRTQEAKLALERLKDVGYTPREK